MATGVFAPGEEIPSRRDLAQRLKINPNTVQRAYKEMEMTGLIFTDSNTPSRITKDEQILNHVRDELIDQAIDDFVSAISSINVPYEEVNKRLAQRYRSSVVEKGVVNDD